MKNQTFAGTTLILLGVCLLILGGIHRARNQETAALRSLRASDSPSDRLAALPFMGAAVALGGVAVTIAGVKRG